MNTKQLLWWLLLIFGEAIIVAAFLLFRSEGSADNIFIMNITVTSLVYLLLFFIWRVPWVDPSEKSGRVFGAMGINWLVTGLYAAAAVSVMICGALTPMSFKLQLIIHCVLLFCLFVGLFAARHAADKVEEVYHQQKENARDGVGDRPLSSFVQENRDSQSQKN